MLYDLVKREAGALEAKKIPPGRLANRLDEWLADYRKLNLIERPGLLHSLLLGQVLKGRRVWSGLLAFARWWDPAHLRPEDAQPYQAQGGRTLPSLAMRLAYALAHAITEKTASANNEDVTWAEGFVTQARLDNPDDQWLRYYDAKRLMGEGRGAEARAALLPVTRRQRRAAWAWDLLGQTFEGEDAEKAITCFYQAVRVSDRPETVVKTRARLARLLAAAGRFHEAARQVRAALEVRWENGYHTPPELARLERADWYRRIDREATPPEEPDVTEAAEHVLFGEVTFRLGVVDHQNREKKLAHVAFEPDVGTILRYGRFRGVSEVPVGTVVEIGCAQDAGTPTSWRKSDAAAIEGFFVERVGELTQPIGQTFAFVVLDDGERVFVPPDVLQSASVSVGERAICRALMSRDRRHDRLGWRALWLRPAARSEPPGAGPMPGGAPGREDAVLRWASGAGRRAR